MHKQLRRATHGGICWCLCVTDRFCVSRILRYYSGRKNRCRDFFYLGCGGTANRFANHTACMTACMPHELRQSQQLAKLRASAAKKHRETASSSSSGGGAPEGLSDLGGEVSPRQDCRVTPWGGWGPCSVRCASQGGHQLRLRAIIRPARYGGVACGPLFEKRQCLGDDHSC